MLFNCFDAAKVRKTFHIASINYILICFLYINSQNLYRTLLFHSEMRRRLNNVNELLSHLPYSTVSSLSGHYLVVFSSLFGRKLLINVRCTCYRDVRRDAGS